MYRNPDLLLAVALVLCAAVATAEEGPGSLFHDKVAPLLKKRCGKCHTEEKRKGGFSMNTRVNLLQGGMELKSENRHVESHRRKSHHRNSLSRR